MLTAPKKAVFRIGVLPEELYRDGGVQHHICQPPVAFDRMFVVIDHDRLLLPRLQPMVARHPRIVFVHAAEKRGQPPGDLYIRVHIAPHDVFRPRGDDIEMDLAVSPWEAALGAKIRVPTLEENVEMTLPGGSQSGRRLRLKGKGLPKSNGERGDLYVALKVMGPENLTDRERELFEQLAQESPFDPRSENRD